MAITDIVTNAWGVLFVVTIQQDDAAIDISGFTVDKKIYLKSPNGTVTPLDATFVTNGLDGKLEATVEAGNLALAGNWELQAYLESATQSIPSEIAEFVVKRSLISAS